MLCMVREMYCESVIREKKKISILFVIVTKNAILIRSTISVHMFDRRFIVLSHDGRRFMPHARSN